MQHLYLGQNACRSVCEFRMREVWGGLGSGCVRVSVRLFCVCRVVSGTCPYPRTLIWLLVPLARVAELCGVAFGEEFYSILFYS